MNDETRPWPLALVSLCARGSHRELAGIQAVELDLRSGATHEALSGLWAVAFLWKVLRMTHAKEKRAVARAIDALHVRQAVIAEALGVSRGFLANVLQRSQPAHRLGAERLGALADFMETQAAELRARAAELRAVADTVPPWEQPARVKAVP